MKRHTHYSRCIIETFETERIQFAPEHYTQVGEHACKSCGYEGIEELKALCLVNDWNSHGLKYIYWV
jgi:hypothetical protein